MLIGFYGKLGSGKDTAADRLISMYNMGTNSDRPVIRFAFADKMKESAAAAIGQSVDTINKYKNDPDVFVGMFMKYQDVGFTPVLSNRLGDTNVGTVRDYIQRFGTEGHRDVFGDNFWVDMSLPLDYDHINKLVVVTDVRFPNEADRVQELGGTVVRVLGPDGDKEGTHSTEQTLTTYDYTIQNHIRDDNFKNLDSQLLRLPLAPGAIV